MIAVHDDGVVRVIDSEGAVSYRISSEEIMNAPFHLISRVSSGDVDAALELVKMSLVDGLGNPVPADVVEGMFEDITIGEFTALMTAAGKAIEDGKN